MRIFCIFLFSSIILFSCSSEPVKVKLSPSEKNLIDSLYKDRIIGISSELDSLCIIYREENFQRIKDSVIAIRLQEIEQILPGR